MYLIAGIVFVGATVIAFLLIVSVFVLNEWVESLFSSKETSGPKVDVDIMNVEYSEGFLRIHIENESKSSKPVICQIELEGLSLPPIVVRLDQEAQAIRVVMAPPAELAGDFSITPNCSWE